MSMESDLAETVLLLGWWLEWPGHPGYADPRCWATDQRDFHWGEEEPVEPAE